MTEALTGAQETAQLEAQAYELEQKTAIAHEAKAVLDSWVRYEGQVKQRQQRELAESVIAKIEKELENPKVLKQILDQSVADVERKFYSPMASDGADVFRDRVPEGISGRKAFLNSQKTPCYIHLCNSQSGPIDYQNQFHFGPISIMAQILVVGAVGRFCHMSRQVSGVLGGGN